MSLGSWKPDIVRISLAKKKIAIGDFSQVSSISSFEFYRCHTDQHIMYVLLIILYRLFNVNKKKRRPKGRFPKTDD